MPKKVNKADSATPKKTKSSAKKSETVTEGASAPVAPKKEAGFKLANVI